MLGTKTQKTKAEKGARTFVSTLLELLVRASLLDQIKDLIEGKHTKYTPYATEKGTGSTHLVREGLISEGESAGVDFGHYGVFFTLDWWCRAGVGSFKGDLTTGGSLVEFFHEVVVSRE